MYSKVINPEKDGKVAFNNKGSALRLGNYLEKELDTDKTPDGKLFFNASGNFSKDEMVAVLDNNVKGLKADDDKFYSLILSPSQAELEHIGNDANKLRTFANACMENYAQNFQLKAKNGVVRKLTEKDLVWFGNIEYDRTYKGDDDEVKNGSKKQGERKDGLQTHIHITVSARDAGMKITLNPRTNDKNRFSILAFAEKNQKSFNELFDFTSYQQTTFKNERKEVWDKIVAVEKQLNRFEKKMGVSEADCSRIREIAKKKDFSFDFRNTLKEVGKQLKKEGSTQLSSQQWEDLKNAKTDTHSLNLMADFQKGYHFFKGVESFEGEVSDRNLFQKMGNNFKKKLKTQQQNQSMER